MRRMVAPGPDAPHGADADRAVARLLAVVSEVAGDVRGGGPPPDVTIDSRLDADLGLDSLGVAELLVRVEELFAVSLPESVLATVLTPRDLLAEVGAATALPVTPAPPARAHGPHGPPAAPPSGGGRAASLGSVLYGSYALAVFWLVGAVAWLLVLVAPTLALRWRTVGAAGRLLLRATGVRLTIHGRDELPSGGPVVVAANHASFLDPLVLAVLLDEPVAFAAVDGLADNRLVRVFLRRMGAHLVARGDRTHGVLVTSTLTEVVRSGRSVGFFPEGRRSPAHGLEPFRLGAFRVAADAGVPVVPIALRGTRDLLPVGQILPRRAPITATVCTPVTTDVQGWDGVVALHRATREAVLRHCGEPDLT